MGREYRAERQRHGEDDCLRPRSLPQGGHALRTNPAWMAVSVTSTPHADTTNPVPALGWLPCLPTCPGHSL